MDVTKYVQCPILRFKGFEVGIFRISTIEHQHVARLVFYIFLSINLLAPVSTQAGMFLPWSVRQQRFLRHGPYGNKGYNKVYKKTFKNISSCQTFVKQDCYKLKYLFPAQPSPFPRHNGKYNNLYNKLFED